MDLQSYHLRRQQLEQEAFSYRKLCLSCLQPEFGCYCQHIRQFDAKIKFVILIHPIETKRRIATGRMSHLCLKNSELIVGQDYSANSRVNEILNDQQNYPLILYPGRQSLNITDPSFNPGTPVFPAGKTPVLFVIDGTWATARRTMNQSENLKLIPRICFTPPKPSNFRVRKQPAPQCYSTIEAIHYAIELLAWDVGFNTQHRDHDNLLFVFSKMVDKQLAMTKTNYRNQK